MSKRLLMTIIGIIIWITLIYTTKYAPVELATSLLLVIGGYLSAETIRSSEKKKETKDI